VYRIWLPDGYDIRTRGMIIERSYGKESRKYRRRANSFERKRYHRAQRARFTRAADKAQLMLNENQRETHLA